MSNKENMLLKRVKANDEDALTELFELYRPMVEKVKQRYFIRIYDFCDWEQEALICCHEAAMEYDEKKGKFGSFFKRKLTNRIISMVRIYNSKSRSFYEKACSYEEILEHDLDGYFERSEEMIHDFHDEIKCQEFIDKLSSLERYTLQIILGQIPYEEAIEHLDGDKRKLKRAETRVLQKFIQVLYQD